MNLVNRVKISNNDHWKSIYKKVIYNEDWSNIVGCYMKPHWLYITKKFSYKNHPKAIQKVNKGEAKWLNSYTILTGYKLKKNPEIVRPIFQYHKVPILNNLLNDIIKYSKFISAQSRKSLYTNTLMEIKSLPIEIVHLIISWTWDPELLL